MRGRLDIREQVGARRLVSQEGSGQQIYGGAGKDLGTRGSPIKHGTHMEEPGHRRCCRRVNFQAIRPNTCVNGFPAGLLVIPS